MIILAWPQMHFERYFEFNYYHYSSRQEKGPFYGTRLVSHPYIHFE